MSDRASKLGLLITLCAFSLLLGGSLAARASAAPAPGEVETLAASPVRLTGVTIGPRTNLIYALENGGTKSFRYDASTNAWSELAEAPLNIGNNGGATYLNGKIYASATHNSEAIEVYDIAADSWSTIPNPLGEGTADITQAGEEIYMVHATNFVKYNPATEVKTTLANAPAFKGKNCEEGFEEWGGLQPYKGKIYGHQGNGCKGFAVYDIAGDSWSELPEVPLVEGEGEEGPVAGSALDPVTGTYFAYGPYGGHTLFKYDIATSSWSTFALPFDVDDGGLAYMAEAGRRGIYAVQGEEGTGFIRYVTREPAADLSVSETTSASSTPIGGEFTYTAQITNAGPDEAVNVTASIALPTNVSLIAATSSQGSCSGTTSVTCAVGSLASGAGATVTLRVKANAAGVGTLSTSVSSETQDPSAANNSAAATATIVVPAAAPSVLAPAPCVSTRSELIHWRSAKHVALKGIAITINGKLYARLSGHARSAKVSFQGRPAGKVAVKISGSTRGGKTYSTARIFHLCQTQRADAAPASLYLKRMAA
ncbi:MAG: DUF11 domain-containing protein [Solirubrobacterales bacterium]|nr:DUF11 domain-containing protein [Solirubrobacterales bacterium]